MSAKIAKPELVPYGGRGLGEGATVCSPPTSRRKVSLCMTRLARPGAAVRGPDDVCAAVRGLEHADRESLYALHLDTKNRVIGVEEIAKGTLSAVETTPREVFKGAILSNANAIIMVHNHPSGDPSPSSADVEFTKRLGAAGKLLGIPLRDHVIVGDGSCKGMSDSRSHGIEFGDSRRYRRR